MANACTHCPFSLLIMCSDTQSFRFWCSQLMYCYACCPWEDIFMNQKTSPSVGMRPHRIMTISHMAEWCRDMLEFSCWRVAVITPDDPVFSDELQRTTNKLSSLSSRANTTLLGWVQLRQTYTIAKPDLTSTCTKQNPRQLCSQLLFYDPQFQLKNRTDFAMSKIPTRSKKPKSATPHPKSKEQRWLR